MQVGVDQSRQFNFIRYWSTEQATRPLADMESIACSAASMAILYNEDTSGKARAARLRNAACIVCLTHSGAPAALIAKYRPPAVVFCVSANEHTVRQANGRFGLCGIKVDSLALSLEHITKLAHDRLQQMTGANIRGAKVIIVSGRGGGSADADAVVQQHRVRTGGMHRKLKSTGAALTTAAGTPLALTGCRSLRTTRTNLSLLTAPLPDARATRIICTMGPACWSEQGMASLLDAGCDVIRLNFSHGSHQGEPILPTPLPKRAHVRGLPAL